jgi:uncharacterized protein YjiS (DUF1127 family)
MRKSVTTAPSAITVRLRVWRIKLRRLLNRPTQGVERRQQDARAKLSDHALRDIGLTRMDFGVEPQGRLGGSKPADP